MSTEPDAHDLVAYPAHAYPNTHPDMLAVIGMLHDLDAAPVGRCRVLEVGCNEGANLIPMAYAIPGSEFVGFDIAGQPVARGQRRIEALGLRNIRLFQANLTAVEASLGRFDYIIAHGVYAWVDETAREELLALCRRHLGPNGIAFISYNALPGGHVKNMLREILLQGMAGTEDPAEGVTAGFALLRLITAARPEGDPFRALLEKELVRLEKRGPQAVFHDELSRDHRPVLFTEFIAHASANGLQYLGESTLPPPNDISYKPGFAGAAKARAQGDPIAHEQLLDFARMRMYRETLLCHADRALSSDLSIELLDRLRLSSQVASAAGEGAVLRVYTLPGGIRMESSHRGTVVLMDYLVQAWPASVLFPEVAEMLAAEGIALDRELFRLLFQLVVSRMVELHAWQAPVSHVVSIRPRSSRIARQEAVGTKQVTTLLHGCVGLDDPLVRQLLLLLDGSKDRAALIGALRRQHPDVPESGVVEGLEASLCLLNRAGLLVSDTFVE